MKNFLIFLLSFSFLLTGCTASFDKNESDPNKVNSTSTLNSSINDSTGDYTSDNSDIQNSDKEKIALDSIASARPFSEGKTFVRLKGDKYEKISCIDKEGYILLEIPAALPNVIVGFHNEISAIRFEGNTVYLCDGTGKITTPADLGADAFLFDTSFSTNPTLPFTDGYIFARKTQTSFEEATHQVAIFQYKNNIFEKIVDFSSELYSLYQKYFDNLNCKYYDGYLYRFYEEEFCCLNLRTGEESYDREEFLNNIAIKHFSDFWEYDDKCFYNLFDSKTPIIDLSQYTTIKKIGNFENGTAPILFETQDETVGKMQFFTILKEDGSFAFEPIRLQSLNNQIQSCNGTYLIIGEQSKGCFLTTFDCNGKIAETSCVFDSSFYTIYFSDNIIIVDPQYDQHPVHFYNINLNPLF